MADVYYNPEALGLEKLAELDDPNACYSFDILLVVKDAEGTVYTAEGSGCSCPSPFEDFNGVDDLTPMPDHSTFCDVVDAYVRRLGTYSGTPDEFHCDANELKAKALSWF